MDGRPEHGVDQESFLAILLVCDSVLRDSAGSVDFVLFQVSVTQSIHRLHDPCLHFSSKPRVHELFDLFSTFQWFNGVFQLAMPSPLFLLFLLLRPTQGTWESDMSTIHGGHDGFYGRVPVEQEIREGGMQAKRR
mmetsp:Transcript_10432/g.17549  ORF Transcript_10432/g.17549 Transcript_10432/m.17549 type:complete len:135 (+) Transcript_10432:151-555(+)